MHVFVHVGMFVYNNVLQSAKQTFKTMQNGESHPWIFNVISQHPTVTSLIPLS